MGTNFTLFIKPIVKKTQSVTSYFNIYGFYKNAEEAFIPGMGPDDKVENQDQEEADLIIPIPGLDLHDDISPSRPEKPAAKKTPYQKPIPKKFQAIWNDTKVDLVDDELDDERGT